MSKQRTESRQKMVAARRERLKGALKANISRRKAQVRSRFEQGGNHVSQPDDGTEAKSDHARSGRVATSLSGE